MDILIHRHVICECIQHSWQPMGLNESTLGVAKNQQQSTTCSSVKYKNPKLGIIMNLIFTIDATCKIEHNNGHIHYIYIYIYIYIYRGNVSNIWALNTRMTSEQ